MIVTHVAFDATMNILIALNMIPISFELSVSDTVWYMKYLKYINYAYCGIYILEGFVKVSDSQRACHGQTTSKRYINVCNVYKTLFQRRLTTMCPLGYII